MLILRTILLWVAFLLLIVLEFLPSTTLSLGIIFRLVPSGLLVVWFLLYLVGRKKFKLKQGVGRNVILVINIFRTTANISILTGAILKIMHLPYSQLLLVTGIGFLALWSTILIPSLEPRSDYDPEIIDDLQDDPKEE